MLQYSATNIRKSLVPIFNYHGCNTRRRENRILNQNTAFTKKVGLKKGLPHNMGVSSRYYGSFHKTLKDRI